MRTIKHPIDKDAPADIIVQRFGGLSKMSRATGYTTSTIRKWQLKGLIPGGYMDAIIVAGDTLSPKLRIKPVDFVTRRKVADV